MSAIKVENLVVKYGDLRAVSDVSLNISDGEAFGIIGKNGAGKTTVFNMLSGVYKPTSGTITFVDKKGELQVINKKSPAPALETQLSKNPIAVNKHDKNINVTIIRLVASL